MTVPTRREFLLGAAALAAGATLAPALTADQPSRRRWHPDEPYHRDLHALWLREASLAGLCEEQFAALWRWVGLSAHPEQVVAADDGPGRLRCVGERLSVRVHTNAEVMLVLAAAEAGVVARPDSIWSWCRSDGEPYTVIKGQGEIVRSQRLRDDGYAILFVPEGQPPPPAHYGPNRPRPALAHWRDSDPLSRGGSCRHGVDGQRVRGINLSMTLKLE